MLILQHAISTTYVFCRCGPIQKRVSLFARAVCLPVGGYPSTALAHRALIFLYIKLPSMAKICTSRCLTDARLSALASNLITSFVYSHDVVSRISLGSIRDMNRAAAWLCQSNASGTAEGGYADVTRRALKWRTGF